MSGLGTMKRRAAGIGILGALCLLLLQIITGGGSSFRKANNIVPYTESDAWLSASEHTAASNRKSPAYVPGPCLSSNSKNTMQRRSYSQWSLTDIDDKRKEWQRWIKFQSPHLNTSIDQSYSIQAQRGLVPPRILPEYHSERGIVIPFYVKHVDLLAGCIRLIRKLGCNLPIEIWSFREEVDRAEFEKENKILSNLITIDTSQGTDNGSFSTQKLDYGHVTLRYSDDVANYLPLTRGSDKDAYHIKASAMINSRFEEVLLLDVDVIPLSNPEYLFGMEEYEDDGAIFFPDYWKTDRNNPFWRWLGSPCLDEWEQESGMMVVNRRRAWAALHLLWYVHRDHEIRFWHRFLLGDKDMFRFSWKATNTPYHAIQHWLVPGGYVVPNRSVGSKFCGIAMMQHDPRGRLLFAHVNLLKHNDKRRFFNNTSELPLWYIKRYKRPQMPVIPAGSKPGSRLAFVRTRGNKAFFPSVPGHNCVDILAAYHDEMGAERLPGIDGIMREVEIVDLETAIGEGPINKLDGTDHEIRTPKQASKGPKGNGSSSSRSVTGVTVSQSPPVPQFKQPPPDSIAMMIWSIVQPMAQYDIEMWPRRQEYTRKIQKIQTYHIVMSVINPFRIPCKLRDSAVKAAFSWTNSGWIKIEPPNELPKEMPDGWCMKLSYGAAFLWWVGFTIAMRACSRF
ncbi:mannosyltransferase putative-domain-containing protein [Cladochytrium replicatum]|nr:mannosyltransferase putative-domain-containing protein [Cladochytrium replicatum]